MGRPSPVAANTTVTLTIASSVSLYLSAACAGAPLPTTPSLTVSIGAGSSQTTFYARGTSPGTFPLTASAPSLTPANQSVTLLNGPDTLVFTNTPPSPHRAGQCFPLSYQTQRMGSASPVASNTSVAFGVSPSGAARYYSDATCLTPTSSQVIAAGSSTGSVFVRVLTGGTPVTLQANAGLFTPASLVTTALPMVRRGSCTFPAQSWIELDGGVDAGVLDGGVSQVLSVNCTLSPLPVTAANTMLFIQSSTPGPFSDGLARCRLGTTASDSLRCIRRSGEAAATVNWQVVEVPSGVRVATVTSTACPSSVTLPIPVDPAKTFLLKTQANSSTAFDDEDLVVLTLTGPTSVSLSQTQCQGIDVQAVEWDGVTVTRGELDGGLAVGQTTRSVLGLTPATTQRAVLAQPGTNTNGDLPMCAVLARTTVPGPGEVAFTRAMGDGGCATTPLDRVEFERLDFGSRATVQERTLTFNPTVSSMVSTITAVDASRTFIFASNQGAFGQSLGETSSPVFASPQEATFSFELTTSTTVTVRRLRSASTAAVTFYVVQIE